MYWLAQRAVKSTESNIVITEREIIMSKQVEMTMTNGIETTVTGAREIEVNFRNEHITGYVTFTMFDDPELRRVIMKDGEVVKEAVCHRFNPATKGIFAYAMADYLLELRQYIVEDMGYDCDIWKLFHTLSLSQNVQIPNPGKFASKEAFINHILRRQRSIDEKNLKRLIGTICRK